MIGRTRDRRAAAGRRRPRPGAWLLGLGVAACSAAPPTLPFDARPAMNGLRADLSTIARELADGRISDAPEAAARVAATRLAVGYEAATDPRFLAFERALTTQAGLLVEALDQGDRRAAGEAFSLLLDRCDRCHEVFRPGGAAGR